ncbi:MAG TPA: hypothetical protein VF536_11050 [Roseateles sp.]
MAVLWKDGTADAALSPVPSEAVDEGRSAEGVLTAPFDVVAYAGPVTVDGYERLSDLLESQKRHCDVLLILETAGGDPDAAFRMARALGFHYRRVHALIPRHCKSAGTLIALGASALYMDDRSELGPLDMQVSRGDEIGAMSSSLEQSTAASMLLAQYMDAFKISLADMCDFGLSTKVASEIAANLAAKLIRPLAEQVDPHRMAEMHRAVSIAHAYGQRLAERGGNIGQEALAELVSNYPSHSFVIDRKEARSLFRRVWPVQEPFRSIARRYGAWLSAGAQSVFPVVSLQSFPFDLKDCSDDQDHAAL